MDRRAIAEESYRQKFEEFGLSDRFVFLRREWSMNHDKRFWSKCKTCGAEFLSWPEVFKGRQKHLLCPECGIASDGDDIFIKSDAAEKAAKYYIQGHSVRETAEKFNVSTGQINNLAKKRKITNGRNWKEANIEDQKKKAEKRIADRISAFGFDYLELCSDGSTRIQCRKCGAEYLRSHDFLRDGNVICVECQKQETKIRNEQKRMLSQQQAEARRIEREEYKLLHPPKDSYEDTHEDFLNRSGICEICGKSYTVREYVQSTGIKYARDSGVCSLECRDERAKRNIKKSHEGRQDSHRHRAIKYGCVYDSSVTLKKLIMRDGLRCAICGEMCDPDDRSWSKYSGPMYPSIDHIVPMSKGGGHTWDNVQVAHIICNSEKGNSVKEVV